MAESIKQRVEGAVKDAMRAREKERLAALRLMMSEFKRIEVDERIELDDQRVLAILDKMTKQRKDSLAQFKAAGREDLVAVEARELSIIDEFLPEALSEAELVDLVSHAVATSGATTIQDMGKVMALLKSDVQGRADMGLVSTLVKKHLG